MGMNLRGHYKQFDQDKYNKNDARAKNFGLKILNHDGAEPLWYENPDKYGPDLTDGFEFVEVEMKWEWTGPYFNFDTLHLPERKKKWRHLPIEYWIINRELSCAAIIDASEVKDEYLKEVRNRRFPNGGEYFFKIPVANCRWVRIEVEDNAS